MATKKWFNQFSFKKSHNLCTGWEIATLYIDCKILSPMFCGRLSGETVEVIIIDTDSSKIFIVNSQYPVDVGLGSVDFQNLYRDCISILRKYNPELGQHLGSYVTRSSYEEHDFCYPSRNVKPRTVFGSDVTFKF